MPTPIPRSLPAVGGSFSLENVVAKVTSFFAIIVDAYTEAQQMRLEARRRYPRMEE